MFFRGYLESHYIKVENPSESSLEFTSRRPSAASDYMGEYKDEVANANEIDDIIVISKPLPLVLEVDEEATEEEEQKAIPEFLPMPFKEVQVRTLKKPVSKTKILPPLNLKDYYLRKTKAERESQVTETNEELIEEEQVTEEEDINKYLFN